VATLTGGFPARFSGDDFSEPDPAVAEVPRRERIAQAAELRDLLG
jgi:hypothetical protein